MPRKKDETDGPAPAPGPLELVQAFLNTKDMKKNTDALSNPWQLCSWLSSRQLLPEDVMITKREWRRALDMREGLRGLLHAQSGLRPKPPAVGRFAKAARGGRLEAVVDADGSIRLEPASPCLEDALAALLAKILEARHDGSWARFKVCANKGCRAAYYDTYDRALWCTRRCGDLMRSRALRQSKKDRLFY